MANGLRLEEIERLYRQAFAEFGPVALWNMRPVERSNPGAAMAITGALRTHGSMAGRRLAGRIEELCRAAHQASISLAAAP
jgi:hypothetical protein